MDYPAHHAATFDAANHVPGYAQAHYVRWAAADILREHREHLERTRPLVVYTDGSGTQAHLPCGAGAVVYDGDVIVLEASRHLGCGTNNHAEISAVRVALAITDTPAWKGRPLVIRTDSMCAIGALTRPDETKAHKPNAKLIAIVRRMLVGRAVTFEHVKGHAGVEGNERADRLANLGRLRWGVVVAVRRAA